MNRALIPSLILATTALCSCAEADAPQHQLSCDAGAAESSEIVYAFRQASRSDRSAPEELIMNQNGHIFFYVDNQCNYWMRPGGGMWAHYLHGKLDEPTLEKINSQGLDWQGNNDKSLSEQSAYDAPTWQFYNAPYKFEINCIECASFKPVITSTVDILNDMSLRSEVHRSSKIWLSARELSDAQVQVVLTKLPAQDAPVGLDIEAAAAAAYNSSLSDALLIDDPSVIKEMDDMLETYNKPEHLYEFSAFNFILIKSDDKFYSVRYRHTLPFEGDDGVVAYGR